MSSTKLSYEPTFHGIEYMAQLTITEDSLKIELEQKDTFQKWSNSFLASYIEEITLKTGNHKKFDVFVKMLQSALIQTSDSVFLDLLTYKKFPIFPTPSFSIKQPILHIA